MYLGDLGSDKLWLNCLEGHGCAFLFLQWLLLLLKRAFVRGDELADFILRSVSTSFPLHFLLIILLFILILHKQLHEDRLP